MGPLRLFKIALNVKGHSSLLQIDYYKKKYSEIISSKYSHNLAFLG